MNCDQTQKCMLYLWGEMSKAESDSFAEHLEQCSACKAEVQKLAPVVRSMQAVDPEELPKESAERVRRRLTVATQKQSNRFWIAPRRALAVAASILLILGLGIMYRLILNPSEQVPDSGAGQVAETLTEEDYVGVLALVWVSESEPDEESLIDTEIEDIATDIEDLLQQVDENSVPKDSDGQPNGARGSQRSLSRQV